MIFAAFHDYGGGNGGGSYSVYEIDENSGTVSGHSYDTLNENDVLNKRVLAVELYREKVLMLKLPKTRKRYFGKFIW